MSEMIHLDELRETMDGIPRGLYEKEDRNLYCVVVGYTIDVDTKDIIILHRRLSDNYIAIWSLEASKFLKKYNQVDETDELLKHLKDALTIIIADPKAEVSSRFRHRQDPDLITYNFPTVEEAASFVAYLEVNGISYQ